MLSIPGNLFMELIDAVHQRGAAFRFRADGFSMYPSIRNGDIITLSPLGRILPFRGEVVACRHPRIDRLIVHRVIRISGNVLVTRGDNCLISDGEIKLENLLGVVVKVERGRRKVYWPDRFHRLGWAKCYFGISSIYVRWRRVLRQPVVKLIRRLRRD